jgi:hypothetical protein
MRALHENDAGVFDDDGAHADQWHFGEFALHGGRILKQKGFTLCSPVPSVFKILTFSVTEPAPSEAEGCLCG